MIMSQLIQQQLTITDNFVGQRLDKALAKLLPEYSRTQIQGWLVSGELTVNGHGQQHLDKNYQVKGGEQVVLKCETQAIETWAAQPIPLDIVYEDDSVLLINKPAGLTVHPGAGTPDGTLANALLHYDSRLAELPRAGVVHRLDKDTTGLLVVAKTLTARTALITQLQDHSMSREYDAVIVGRLTAGFSVELPIGRHPKQRIKMAVLPAGAGKAALTHVRVVERFYQHTWVRVKLETGRTHQIRVHLAHRRHPLVGDQTYGQRLKLPPAASVELIDYLRHFSRQALHASALACVHPASSQNMDWQVDMPDDMKKLISLLREHAKTQADE